MKERTEMSETQTKTADIHLAKIAERGGSHIESAVRGKIDQVSIDRLNWNEGPEKYQGHTEQPTVDAVLNDIAEASMHAHAELGNAAKHEEVWKRSVEKVTEQINALLLQGDVGQAQEKAMTLISMAALDHVSSLRTKKGFTPRISSPPSTIIDEAIKFGAPKMTDVLRNASLKAARIGLCVDTTPAHDPHLVPVNEFVQQVIWDAYERVEMQHLEANEVEFTRRSPEENDADLQRLVDSQNGIFSEVFKEGDTYLGTTYISASKRDHIAGILKTGNYSTESADEILRTLNEHFKLIDEKQASQDYPLTGHNQMTIDNILTKMPPKVLKDLYETDGSAVKEMLLREAGVGNLYIFNIGDMANILSSIYECDPIDLKYDFASTDEVVQALTGHHEYKSVMMNSFRDLSKPYRSDFGSDEQYEVAIQDHNMVIEKWLKKCMEKVIGLPPSLSSELREVSFMRTRVQPLETHDDEDSIDDVVPGSVDTDVSQQDGRKFRATDLHNLGRLVEKLDDITKHLPPEALVELREKTGIINFDYYSPAQLERMLRLTSGDQELIDDLRAGDVTAVFMDARGDHNGAFSENPYIYEKPSERTVFFEIHQKSDLYRFSILLKNLGIADSTRVLAAHGGKMGLVFGKEDQFSIGTSDISFNWQRNIKAGDISGIRRIAEEFMQASRGIDDPDERTGKKMLILESCMQGKQLFKTDGTPSRPTTAEGFVRNIRNKNFEVYAATQSIGAHKIGNELFWTTLNGELAMRKFKLASDGSVAAEDIGTLELYKREENLAEDVA